MPHKDWVALYNAVGALLVVFRVWKYRRDGGERLPFRFLAIAVALYVVAWPVVEVVNALQEAEARRRREREDEERWRERNG